MAKAALSRLAFLWPIIARVLLRVIAGFLVAKALFDQDQVLAITDDPSVQTLLETVLAGLALLLSELWLWIGTTGWPRFKAWWKGWVK